MAGAQNNNLCPITLQRNTKEKNIHLQTKTEHEKDFQYFSYADVLADMRRLRLIKMLLLTCLPIRSFGFNCILFTLSVRRSLTLPMLPLVILSAAEKLNLIEERGICVYNRLSFNKQTNQE